MQVIPKDNPDVSLSESAAESSLSRDFNVPLPVSEPFTNITISLRVLADLSSHKDNSPIHHKVTLTCPWSSSASSGSNEAVEEEEKIVPLQFLPPFQSSFRLHTAHQRKFLHITIAGLSSRAILLRKGKLSIVNEGNSKEFYSYLSLKELNPGSQNLTVINGTDVSYMWELGFGADQENMKGNHQLYFGGANPPATIHIEFRLEYAGVTLYEVKSRVEPSKGSEFCRAGGMCHLRLQILRLGPPPPPVAVASTLQHPSLTSLMYEVLADQTMWAICGRTAGVISLDGEVDKQNVTLDVMPLMGGFLPLPLVRLSKYIPMDSKVPPGREGMSQHPRLEPFSPGQVYNSSKAQQVHVLPSVPPNTSAELPVS
ncbi:hypothetical protein J437_LFUL002080 [Ladona fulva]|uniref:Uncharacterized protein n=1 Tax=Ladona fulva TaxID=123851 RepID=A0A8K0K048_LADFU|nr:hypothetical protein J437_LFUL002080 [Ladona fulva]